MEAGTVPVDVGLSFCTDGTTPDGVFPDGRRDESRCAVVCEVNNDGMETLDVSPLAYIRIKPPPRTSSPTITATPPRRWAHSTLARKPHPPLLSSTTLPAISALSWSNWMSACWDECRVPCSRAWWRWSSVPSSAVTEPRSSSKADRRGVSFFSARGPVLLLLAAEAGFRVCVSASLPPSHPGMSLQPSSPLLKASSPKPLPIHSGPLKPSLGRSGPNAAGRARKKVELSSVRLMMADGGNSEPGDVKEKRALTLDCFCARDAPSSFWSCCAPPRAT